MWIRSQDKTKLLLANRILVAPSDEYVSEILNLETTYDVISKGYIAGTYTTKEKAMKVLDMIEKAIAHTDMLKVDEKGKLEQVHMSFVFQMPKDEEV